MKIVGVLSWYDESPHWLSTAIAGMARLCDAIVAVDGAYGLYPSARPRSHPQQAEAIVHTAEAMGRGVLLYQPDTVWLGNEVEKRNKSLQLAGTLDPDWVVIFDADYHVLTMNEDSVRLSLEHTDLDVATYTILDGKDLLANEALARFATERHADTEWTIRTRDIYRWDDSLEIGPKHYYYSVTGKHERVWLRGPDGHEADALNLDADLVVYHRTQDRAQVRQAAAKEYYDRRVRFDIEPYPESLVA